MDLLSFIQTVLLTGVATTMATELLKTKLIPIPAERNPRLTAIIVSVLASAFVVWQNIVTTFTGFSLLDWATVAIGTLLVAISTYNNLLKPGSQG